MVYNNIKESQYKIKTVEYEFDEITRSMDIPQHRIKRIKKPVNGVAIAISSVEINGIL